LSHLVARISLRIQHFCIGKQGHVGWRYAYPTYGLKENKPPALSLHISRNRAAIKKNIFLPPLLEETFKTTKKINYKTTPYRYIYILALILLLYLNNV